MRKLLLGTTALAAAATLTANAALADVSISGAIEWSYNSRSSNIAANDGTMFGTDSSITIGFTNKTDSGLTLGYTQSMDTDGEVFGNAENDISDVTDLSGFVPNLVVSGQEDQSDIKIFIRGVGTNNPTETGDQGVGVYVDGVYAARAQGALALMYDLENVQVLRGPQGTLFGRNNTGGALLLQTKKPRGEYEADLQLSAGSYNRMQLSGGMTVPVTDTLGIRIAGYTDKDDGWVEAINEDPRGDDHNYGNIAGRTANTDVLLNNTKVSSARITGVWEPTDQLSVTAQYETFSDKGNGGILLSPVDVDAGVFQSYIDSPIFLDLSSDVFRSSVSYDLSDSLNLEYIFGSAELSRRQVVDQDAGILSRFQEARTEYQNTNSYSHEIKLQNFGDERLSWTTGLYYFREETGIRFDFDGQGAWLQGGASFIQPARGAESASVYGQLNYDLTDNLVVTAGVRYTDDLKYDRGGRNIMDCNNQFIQPTLGGSDLSVFNDFLNMLPLPGGRPSEFFVKNASFFWNSQLLSNLG